MRPDSTMCWTSSSAERDSGAGRKERSFSGRLRSSSTTPSLANFQASRTSSRSVVRAAIRSPLLLLTRRRAKFQILEPVEDEIQMLGSRFGGLILDHQETLPVGSDIPAFVVSLEEKLRAGRREDGRSRDGDAQELLVLSIKNFS